MLNQLLRWLKSPATSKDEILKASLPKVREVYIEQFNANVYVRQLSVRDARRLRDETPKGGEKSLDELADELEMYYARLMVYCVLDKNYQPIYTLDDIFNLDVSVFNELFLAITEFNKLNVNIQQVKEELKKVQPEL
jgi:hypothetical protein